MFNGKCRLDKKIICAVVKNMDNCPYINADQCKAENTEGWMGIISERFGSIALKRLRYNHIKIKISVLDNKCDSCGVIWGFSGCPICNYGDI